MSYDTLLVHLGEFGPYHVRIFLLLSAIPIFNALHVCCVIFNNVEPKFRCAVPNYNDTFAIQNEFHSRLLNSSLLYDDDEDDFSECSIYSQGADGSNTNTSSRRITDCHRWVYDEDVDMASLVSDFDLVCDRKVFKTHINMFMMMGTLVGSLLGGPIADYFGRKKVIIATIVLKGLVGFSYTFSTKVPMLFLGRFLLSFLGMIGFMAIFVLLAEIVGPKRRTLVTMGSMFGWCTGLFLSVLVFYLITDWRTAQIVISVPTFVFIFYWWLIPESPRWLLLQNRTAEAEAIIVKIAKVNKVKLPEDMGLLLKNETETAKEPSGASHLKIWRLFTSKSMLVRISILSFSWAAVSMVYFGLTLNIGDLIEGNLYINVTLQSLMELIAYVVCVIILEKVGRKKIFCFFILLSGLACIATGGPLIANSDTRWVDILLFSLGKLGITAAFSVIYIFTAELLPTAYRNSGLGFCSFLGRIAAVTSPYIGNLKYQIPNAFGETLPLLIFGTCSIIAGLTALTLPETKDQKLPDTIAQAKAQRPESRTSSSKKKQDECVI